MDISSQKEMWSIFKKLSVYVILIIIFILTLLIFIKF